MTTTKQKIYAGLFVGATTLLSAFSLYFYQTFNTANFLVDKEDKILYIADGTTFKQLLDSLEAGGFVSNKVSFGFVSKVLKYQEKVRAGRYIIKKNSTNLAVVRKLRSGSQDPVRVTFNNARLKRDLAGKICKNLRLDSLSLLNILNSPQETAKYGFDTLTIVSMFFPDTYEFYWTSSAEDILKRMKREHDKFWNASRKAKAAAMSLTPFQVSVLASIVEAETRQKDEAPRVAGVYMNRLQQNIPLQADPTVIFAIGDFTIKRLLFGHLRHNSPYNTYKYTGLPPGLICVPTAKTIDGTLGYEKHNYLFFCAKEDFSGYHAFAETDVQHMENAKRYQAALNRAGIR